MSNQEYGRLISLRLRLNESPRELSYAWSENKGEIDNFIDQFFTDYPDYTLITIQKGKDYLLFPTDNLDEFMKGFTEDVPANIDLLGYFPWKPLIRSEDTLYATHNDYLDIPNINFGQPVLLKNHYYALATSDGEEQIPISVLKDDILY